MAKLPVSYPSLKLPVDTNFVQAVVSTFQRTAGVVNNPDFGTTAGRPASQLVVGQTYFDVTLDKPIWWQGAHWVDATGATV